MSTLTEAAINVREWVNARASEIANEIWANDERLAEFAGDVFRPRPNASGPVSQVEHATATSLLRSLRDGRHKSLGLFHCISVHQSIEAYSLQQAWDEHEGLIKKPTNTPQLPDCTGCRVDLAGEVECCQEKP